MLKPEYAKRPAPAERVGVLRVKLSGEVLEDRMPAPAGEGELYSGPAVLGIGVLLGLIVGLVVGAVLFAGGVLP